MNAMGWQRVATDAPELPPVVLRPAGAEGDLPGRRRRVAAPVGAVRARVPAGQRGRRRSGDRADRSVVAGGDYETSVRAQAEAFVETAAAIATRPRDEWVRLGAEAKIGLQPILSPEEALLDEPLADEGVIVELDDPELGPIRQVGHVLRVRRGRAARRSGPARRRRPTPPTSPPAWSPRARRRPTGTAPDAPLAGVLVLDFGLAIAGPFGPQILADLGATVIKVTTREFDLTDAIYVGSSHGKQALALDLKHPRGQEIARRLIERADVVHHNMRTGVAERLGIGYEQARAINPAIIYCHTRGFERDGPRTPLPGNDQMGHALAGTAYEAGGTHHGTPPIWQMTAYGDTGNGIISAAAVIQALRHRERTGEGQFVHTSILNVCMLFNSSTYARPDGSGPERDRIDAGQYGFSALQRLYETADGWLCVFVTDDAQWARLCAALDAGHLATDARFADAAARRAADDELAAELGAILAGKDAEHWFARPRRRRRAVRGRLVDVRPRAVRRSRHAPTRLGRAQRATPTSARVEHVAMPFSFSVSDRQNLAGSPVTGQHSRPILRRARLHRRRDRRARRRRVCVAGAVGVSTGRGRMNIDLSGKVALVTGGSRGLGKEMVQAFAAAGADVVISSRKLDACDELAARCARTTGSPGAGGRRPRRALGRHRPPRRRRVRRARARRRPRQQRRHGAAVPAAQRVQRGAVRQDDRRQPEGSVPPRRPGR